MVKLYRKSRGRENVHSGSLTQCEEVCLTRHSFKKKTLWKCANDLVYLIQIYLFDAFKSSGSQNANQVNVLKLF